MSTAKSVTSPFWFPLWFVWNAFALLRKTLCYVFGLAFGASVVILALVGMIVWLWW
jgi:hypothetical protein